MHRQQCPNREKGSAVRATYHAIYIGPPTSSIGGPHSHQSTKNTIRSPHFYPNWIDRNLPIQLNGPKKKNKVQTIERPSLKVKLVSNCWGHFSPEEMATSWPMRGGAHHLNGSQTPELFSCPPLASENFTFPLSQILRILYCQKSDFSNFEGKSARNPWGFDYQTFSMWRIDYLCE